MLYQGSKKLLIQPSLSGSARRNFLDKVLYEQQRLSGE